MRHGISRIKPALHPDEFYRLTYVSRVTGFSANYLRRCPIPKYRFCNRDYLRRDDVNRFIDNPNGITGTAGPGVRNRKQLEPVRTERPNTGD